jgi:sortase A
MTAATPPSSGSLWPSIPQASWFARGLVWSLMSCAVLAAAVFSYALWFSALPQERAQERLYAQLREELSRSNAPLGGTGDPPNVKPIDPGEPVALIQCQQIGLNQVVVEGTSAGDMWQGPGHLRNTPLPGEPGISVIYGHSATFGAPFGQVSHLHPGDTITVTTGHGIYNYRVTTIRRPGDPLPAFPTGLESSLILVTSEGDGWREGWAPNHPVYIDAVAQEPGQLPHSGRPSTITTAEQAMQGDPSAFPVLILWLQLLLAVAGGAVWARIRWTGVQTWLAAAPLLIAALWGVASSASMFLPNIA